MHLPLYIFLLLILRLCSKVIVRTLAYIPEDWESRPYRVVSADWMQVGCPNIFFVLSTYIDDFELWTLNLMSASTPKPKHMSSKLAVVYYILYIIYYILYIIYYISYSIYYILYSIYYISYIIYHILYIIYYILYIIYYMLYIIYYILYIIYYIHYILYIVYII